MSFLTSSLPLQQAVVILLQIGDAVTVSIPFQGIRFALIDGAIEVLILARPKSRRDINAAQNVMRQVIRTHVIVLIHPAEAVAESVVIGVWIIWVGVARLEFVMQMYFQT